MIETDGGVCDPIHIVLIDDAVTVSLEETAAAVRYEIGRRGLKGRIALEGEDLVQFGFSSANPARRPTPRFLGARVSDQLEEAFAKALAVRPEDRFQHAGEFLEGVVDRGLPSEAQAGLTRKRL